MNYHRFFASIDKGKLLPILLFTGMAIFILMQFIPFFLKKDALVFPEPPHKQPMAHMNKQARLFKNNLFGNFLPSSQAIKKSTLQVRLVGIMHSTNSKKSQILLRLTNSEEHFYHSGDVIMKGATIKQINPDHVIILYNGSLERLVLPDDQLHFTKPSQPLLRE